MFGLKNDWVIHTPPRYFTLENYELTVSYADGSEAVYSGYAEITLAKSGSEWLVVGWDESQSSSDQSWGFLRFSLR